MHENPVKIFCNQWCRLRGETLEWLHGISTMSYSETENTNINWEYFPYPWCAFTSNHHNVSLTHTKYWAHFSISSRNCYRIPGLHIFGATPNLLCFSGGLKCLFSQPWGTHTLFFRRSIASPGPSLPPNKPTAPSTPPWHHNRHAVSQGTSSRSLHHCRKAFSPEAYIH